MNKIAVLIGTICFYPDAEKSSFGLAYLKSEECAATYIGLNHFVVTLCNRAITLGPFVAVSTRSGRNLEW